MVDRHDEEGHQDAAWRQYLKENDLIEKVLWGAEFEDYLTNTQAKLKRTLKEAGAL